MAAKRRYSAISEDSAGDRFIVGVDFGTTFSGVAYVWGNETKAQENIEVIKSWPGGNNMTSLKVPTEIAYLGSAPFQTTKWGYQLGPTDRRLRCVKLLLDPGQEFPPWVNPSDLKAQLKDLRKSAEEAAADFLRKVHATTLEALTRRFGKDMVHTTPIDFVLTVPAVWSEAAKAATRRAAHRVGMSNNLLLISEPEAAAVWALNSMTSLNPSVGDVFVICDAGGGTVDLITYEVEKTKPLSFHEVVAGQGGLCGAVMLDLQLEKLVKAKVGDRLWEQIRYNQPRIWTVALKYFEDSIKRSFDPRNESEHGIPLPGMLDDAKAGIDLGFLSLTAHEITTMFDEVVEDIVKLINEQISGAQQAGKTPKAVILVGGFGQSPYLFDKIKSSIIPASCPTGMSSLTVHQPSDAWTAVVRGAVLRGMSMKDQITSRKSPYHYGFVCDPCFDPRRHTPQSKYWDDADDCFRAEYQMEWSLRKNQTITSSQPVLLDFKNPYQIIPKTMTESLYFCKTDTAPTTFVNSEVCKLCSLVIDTKKIPKKAWERKANKAGVRYNHINYQLGVKKLSAVLEFDLRVNEQILGSVQATFG